MPSSLPRATRSSRSAISRREHGVQELGRGRLGGALRAAHALDLGGDQRRDEPQQRRVRRAFAPAQPQLADDRVGDAQLDALDAVRLAQQRALLGGRARGDGEHDARAVDQHEARVERPRGGAHDLRQAGAGRDRLGDRLERPQVRRRRRLVARVAGTSPDCR